ncbi:hypothetical protein K2X30_12565 [bacterium]|nr:hypothetical protein [bacterium]
MKKYKIGFLVIVFGAIFTLSSLGQDFARAAKKPDQPRYSYSPRTPYSPYSYSPRTPYSPYSYSPRTPYSPYSYSPYDSEDETPGASPAY